MVNLFPRTAVFVQDLACSDHAAVWVSLDGASLSKHPTKKNIFRFEAAWCSFQGCTSIIQHAWASVSEIDPSKSAIERIRATHELEGWVGKEEILWKQCAEAHWLEAGDRNTTYSHSKANERRIQKEIKKLLDEIGTEVVCKEGIQQVILKYFRSMFESTHPTDEVLDAVVNCVEPWVTTAMNEALAQPFTSEEITIALKQMHPLKSPGLDEAFSGLIQKAESDGTIQGVAVSRAALVSHLLFADNTLIFCQEINTALSRFQWVLNSYEAAWGLNINKAKSAMVFSRNVEVGARIELTNMLGVTVEPKHDRYLGLPTVSV
ncbi:UNVERIFIED_CONTAM: hypothetical protein Slati_2734700 [Sesamum latifolium]|uniref:Reverse transcriptase domain-containing protein n=1 Tax=Sesamum latifolium TaxID=2727402 RepID=A0AAW2VWA2_9LAMI